MHVRATVTVVSVWFLTTVAFLIVAVSATPKSLFRREVFRGNAGLARDDAASKMAVQPRNDAAALAEQATAIPTTERLSAREAVKATSAERVWPTTRISADGDGPFALFSYGSNSLNQLRSHTQNPTLTAVKALLPDALRCFAGRSTTWGGAVATIVPWSGESVQGNVVMVNSSELKRLDDFEGVKPGYPYEGLKPGGPHGPHVGWPWVGMYRRQDVRVLLGGGTPGPGDKLVDAVTYVKINGAWKGPPTESYLKACSDNRAQFWETKSMDIRNTSGVIMQAPYEDRVIKKRGA